MNNDSMDVTPFTKIGAIPGSVSEGRWEGKLVLRRIMSSNLKVVNPFFGWILFFIAFS